jgi:hypothetical protein
MTTSNIIVDSRPLFFSDVKRKKKIPYQIIVCKCFETFADASKYSFMKENM